jgi:hypothetical protein
VCLKVGATTLTIENRRGTNDKIIEVEMAAPRLRVLDCQVFTVLDVRTDEGVGVLNMADQSWRRRMHEGLVKSCRYH